MANNLNDFFDVIKNESHVRFAYQFQVSVSGPTIQQAVQNLGLSMAAKPNVFGEDFKFFATSTQVPQKTMTTAPVHMHGVKFVVPNVVEFGNTWTCDIRMDRNLNIYRSLESWMAVHSSMNKSGGGFKGIPECKVRIDMLNENSLNPDSPEMSFVLEGVFPTELGQLSLGHENTGILTASMSFAYQYFHTIPGTTTVGDVIGSAAAAVGRVFGVHV